MNGPWTGGSVGSPGGTYSELERRWQALHDGERLRIERAVCRSGRVLLYADIGDPQLPAVAISAGVHGDEPAGPSALLQLAESATLDARCSYRLWPCLNPSGYDQGIRASADGLDINRTFGGTGGSPEASAVLAANHRVSFTLSLDLHEDCDAQGFYCYEYGGGTIGRRVIEALVKEGLSIDPLGVTFGLAGPLDDAHCMREPGRIVADASKEALLLGGLSYSLAMSRAGARHALTFETPSNAPWATRLKMHRIAVRAAVASVIEESTSTSCN
jgi:murein peptide amidase A